jgi:hypothetical protein
MARPGEALVTSGHSCSDPVTPAVGGSLALVTTHEQQREEVRS